MSGLEHVYTSPGPRPAFTLDDEELGEHEHDALAPGENNGSHRPQVGPCCPAAACCRRYRRCR